MDDPTLLLNVLMGCFEAGAVVGAVTMAVGDMQARSLVALCIVNMLLILICIAKLQSLLGWPSHIGIVPNVTVVLCQAIVLERFGRTAAFKALAMILLAVMAFMLLGEVVKHLPNAPGNPGAVAVDLIFSRSTQAAFAIFVGFMVSQYLMIVVADTCRGTALWARYLIAALTSFVLGPLLFYYGATVAAAGNYLAVLSIMSTEVVAKSIVAVLSLPVLYFAVRTPPAA